MVITIASSFVDPGFPIFFSWSLHHISRLLASLAVLKNVISNQPDAARCMRAATMLRAT
jgi:hypothetical protein